MPGLPYTQEEEVFIRENYPLHGSHYCASHLKKSHPTVCQKAIRMGIVLTKEQKKSIHVRARERPYDTYDVDPRQFFQVTTPEVAYVLGFIWADGYVKDRRQCDGKGNYIFDLTIADHDYQALKSTLDRLGKWHIYTRMRKSRSRCPVTTVRTGNKPLIVYLIEKDYGIKSVAAPTKILSTIPDNLKHYFWRGYFDGDGCFCCSCGTSRMSLAGSYDQDWSAHVAWLDSLGIRYKIQKRQTLRGNSSHIVCQNREGIVKVGEYIYLGYKEDGIGLQRKYTKWKKIKKAFDNLLGLDTLVITEPVDFLEKGGDLFDIIKQYNGRVTHRRLAKHFNLSRSQTSYLLKQLCDSGRVVAEGSTQTRVYWVAESLSSVGNAPPDPPSTLIL